MQRDNLKICKSTLFKAKTELKKLEFTKRLRKMNQI